jgi:hypothetical protein
MLDTTTTTTTTTTKGAYGKGVYGKGAIYNSCNECTYILSASNYL